ncbi:MAG: hypothetical protein RR356_04115 [Bacteroidales bacterium]
MLKNKGVVQSMSRKGNCLDHAVMENLFGILKSELLYLRKDSAVSEFAKEFKEYIKAKLKGMAQSIPNSLQINLIIIHPTFWGLIKEVLCSFIFQTNLLKKQLII